MFLISINDPYYALNFNDAEKEVFRLIIQLSKSPIQPRKYEFKKIKATDLIKITKYSKPKVYDLIKRLEDKKLIKIYNTRPMYLKPLDPTISIDNLTNKMKEVLDEAKSKIIEDLESLPGLNLNFPFGEGPPLDYFIGIKKYYNLLDEMLQKAKKLILLICGYLVNTEENLLREYISKKLKEGLEIRILYGGSTRRVGKFGNYFNEHILKQIQANRKKEATKLFIDSGIYLPPLRITIIDNEEMLMVLKRYDKEDSRINTEDISGIYSDNRDFIGMTYDTFIMLKDLAKLDYIKSKLNEKKR
ncbi:MAG: TrmB family transcriptional regulator [Promethearchaeia archaeon]